MNEIKPNWLIAQQISRRHMLLSVGISLSLMLSLSLLSIIILKVIGVPNSGATLKAFLDQHRRIFLTSLFFMHFGPVNYYAIIKVFRDPFSKFELKIVPRLSHSTDDNQLKNR